MGDDAGGAAEAIALMNISKANLVVTTSWLEYDMFPHGWLPDFNSSYVKPKIPLLLSEGLSGSLRPSFRNVAFSAPKISGVH